MSTQSIGLVIRNDGPRFWVDLGGQELPCVLRGRLKKEQLRVTSLVTVGDRVQVEVQPDGTGAIVEVLPRTSELSRPGFHGYVHVIAANVDQLVVVQAAQQPRFRRHTVERYLVAAQRGGMAALVVVNKADLEHEDTLRAWIQPLLDSGVRVLLTSAFTGQGMAELRDALAGRVSVLAGPSGVGKSSLVNALFSDLIIRTNAVTWSNKGRHTTTSSRMFPLPGGGYLADTPGIRTMGLWEPEAEVEGVFPEIEAAAAACKFRDCNHTHEPRCAVKAAVDSGEIEFDRYHHYLRLRRGE